MFAYTGFWRPMLTMRLEKIDLLCQETESY